MVGDCGGEMDSADNPSLKAGNKAATHRRTCAVNDKFPEKERENQLGPAEAPSSCTAEPSGRAPPVTR